MKLLITLLTIAVSMWIGWFLREQKALRAVSSFIKTHREMLESLVDLKEEGPHSDLDTGRVEVALLTTKLLEIFVREL
jgi:hypothetical protein